MWCQKTMSLPSRTLYKTVMVAGYDFSCAFDTMGTRELVAKLREMDVDKKAVLWFKDYLSGRHQRFRYRVDSSTLRLVSYGVPQGRPLRSSLPWPTTFAGSWELTGRAATTASQFTLRRRHRHLDSEQGPQGCKGEAGEVLGKAAIVCLGNSLAHKASKTQLVAAGTRAALPILVGGVQVQPQDELLLLGVKFDKSLSITPHLRSLAGTAKSLLALAKRLLLHLPWSGQVQDMVWALVVGRLCYACILDPPRLQGDPACHHLLEAQVAVSDVARRGSSMRWPSACWGAPGKSKSAVPESSDYQDYTSWSVEESSLQWWPFHRLTGKYEKNKIYC